MRFAVVAFVAALAFSTPSLAQRQSAEAELTPERIRADVAERGAATVVREIWSSERNEVYVVDRIGSGEQVWLEIVPLLEPEADAAAGEGLAIAVSRALPRNATGVLRLISERMPISQVCAMMEIEPAAADVNAYYVAASSAVGAVVDPGLRDVRDSCLAQLRHLQAAARR